jgi:hypothetical protein
MAQQDRVTIQGLINLYITTNGNKEITGAQLKEILTNLNDSAFLQLDELRTALSTAYSPANPSDWNVLPTEVKAALDEAISRVEGLENAGFQTAIQTPYTRTVPADWDGTPNELQSSTDELASRMRVFETNNFSQDVAFVSNDGDDLTGERGNIGKPFATIQSAINAVGNNSIVKVLGGTYTEDIVINTKSNFVLDMSSCNYTMVTTTGFAVENCQNVTILNYGGVMNGYIDIGRAGNLNVNFFGGKIINGIFPCIKLGNKGRVKDVEMENTGNQTIRGEATTVENRPIITNCSIKTTSTTTSHAAIYRMKMSLFENCYIEGPIALSTESNSSYCTLIDCTLVSTLSTTIKGEGAVLNAVLKNCTIKSNTQRCIDVGGDGDPAFFEDCNIIAETDCVIINGNLIRAATARTTFKRCSFYTNTGEIVTGTPNASDLGKTSLIGTTLTNKALLVGLTNFEVLGDQLTVTDAQEPPL